MNKISGTKEKQKKNEKSDFSTSKYLKDLRKLPQLPHEKVVELFQKIESGGNGAKKAKDALIESNLRLVVSVAKKILLFKPVDGRPYTGRKHWPNKGR